MQEGLHGFLMKPYMKNEDDDLTAGKGGALLPQSVVTFAKSLAAALLKVGFV